MSMELNLYLTVNNWYFVFCLTIEINTIVLSASSRAPVLPCRGVRSAVKCDRVSATNEEARLGYVQLQRTLGDVTKIVLG